MGCILYISTFWQDEFHLYSQVSSCKFCICAELSSTASVLCMWHLEREKLTLEAAFNTYRVLRDTATPRNDQVGVSYSKGGSLPGLGLWRCYVNGGSQAAAGGRRDQRSLAQGKHKSVSWAPPSVVCWGLSQAQLPASLQEWRVPCTVAFLGTWHASRGTCEEGEMEKEGSGKSFKMHIVLQGVG